MNDLIFVNAPKIDEIRKHKKFFVEHYEGPYWDIYVNYIDKNGEKRKSTFGVEVDEDGYITRGFYRGFINPVTNALLEDFNCFTVDFDNIDYDETGDMIQKITDNYDGKIVWEMYYADSMLLYGFAYYSNKIIKEITTTAEQYKEIIKKYDLIIKPEIADNLTNEITKEHKQEVDKYLEDSQKLISKIEQLFYVIKWKIDRTISRIKENRYNRKHKNDKNNDLFDDELPF